MTMTESNLLSLSQAAQAGLFKSVAAARKAAQRDPRFPEPVAQQYGAFLYDAPALQAYCSARRGSRHRPDLPSVNSEAQQAAMIAAKITERGRTPEQQAELRRLFDYGEWKPIPGAGYYEASHRGHIRSVDRTIGARFYKGTVLKPRADADGYLRVNITNDQRERKHNESVARLVLMAHDPEGYAPGLESCHGPGGKLDNRWPENLRWDTRDANRQEALEVRLANNPPKVKPPKVCPRCNREHTGKGRNCHECVVQIGEQAAYYLAEGSPLDKVADALGYSPAGAFNLAKRYGGLRCVIVDEATASSAAIRHAESQQPRRRRLRSVLSRRGASRQISDGA